MHYSFLKLRSAGLTMGLIAVCGAGLLFAAPTQQLALGQAVEEGTETETENENENENALPEGHFAPTRAGMRLNIVTQDDTRITGSMTTYTHQAIHYVDTDDAEQSVPWDAFDARFAERFYPRLIASNDVEGWYRLAALLARYEDGAIPAERVMRRIERMDPDNTDRHAEMREVIENGGVSSAIREGMTDGEGDNEGSGEGDNDPNETDEAAPRAWPELTDEQQEAAVERLETGIKDALEELRMPMGNTQTERFIVFTDLPRNEARYWVSLLDRLYDRMCGVFGLDSEDNIWQGKCVFVLFNDVQDYYQFSIQHFGFNAQGSGGYCSLRNGGDIYIIMFKHREQDRLATVLVHEAAHAFLFRFVSSYSVPSWLHEGLAEYLVEVLLDNGNAEERLSGARRYVKQRGRLDNFLSARNIIGPHYGIAYDVTDLMIDENRSGYVDMIRGIKEGMTVEEAFEERYGASLETVLKYYGRTRLRIDDLPLN